LTRDKKHKISKNIKISHNVAVDVTPKKLKNKEASESPMSEYALDDIDTKQELKNITALNGLNVFAIDVDCNGMYDVTLANKSKTNKVSKKDKSIILLNDGSSYKPCYKITENGMQGIHDNNDDIIKILVNNASK
jgi:hypothetical protein